MENRKIPTFFSLVAFFLFLSNYLTHASRLQTYIVHVEKPENSVFDSSEDRESWYRSFLPTTIASSDEPRMVYSYGNVISGFAARLTKHEVKAMEEKEGFVGAYPDRLVPLTTTHTPKFLGLQLQDGFLNNSNFGKGVIIGVLDTGVLPNHPSFNDEGMPPPPSKWKGECALNSSDCNNKIIGARVFLSGLTAIKGSAASMSMTDEEGHGTHTASTAAGVFVKDADVLGTAKGTAVGMAPHAHLAIYKVCGPLDCTNSDLLAGFDAAVGDGVDVLSVSIGGDSLPFFEDSIAIGAFGAIEKGVFVSCAAGNSGPIDSTLSNEAPWILTVAASSMDRKLRTTVRLGNGLELQGESVFQPQEYNPTFSPLVYAGASGVPDAAFCGNGSLDGMDVKGKIVLCEFGGGIPRIAKGSFVQSAGGVGMILTTSMAFGYFTLADTHVLPASQIGFTDGLQVKAYINSTYSPTAMIVFKGTILGTSPAPAIAAFSSRGPSLASPGIMKPDITGPGVSVLAAWPFQVGPPNVSVTSSATFNIISGTSMSTPHLSGIAALIKSAHPDWSPAAIKSAIMTSSDLLDNRGKRIVDEWLLPANFFAMGAGHVNPSKAVDPGLVYDLAVEDYISYLCGLNYTSAQVILITRRRIDCSKITSITEAELNYPSITVPLGATAPSYVTVKRTVKRVGEAISTYMAEVEAPEGVSVSVEPKTLQFYADNDEKSFMVTFSSSSGGEGVSEGNLKWVSDKHVVRSPISIVFK